MSDTVVWSAEGDTVAVQVEGSNADAVRALLDRLGQAGDESPADAERQRALTRWVGERTNGS